MTEERGSLRPLTDSLGALLSNPVVLEGLIAGISAFSASRRVKDGKRPPSETQSASGGLLDLLPGILPLLSTLTSGGSGAVHADAAAPVGDAAEEGSGADADGADPVDDASQVGADDVDDPDTDADALRFEPASAPGVFVSDGDRASQRENLLLAIRPFLSDSRRSAADAMVRVNKLSGLLYGSGR